MAKSPYLTCTLVPVGESDWASEGRLVGNANMPMSASGEAMIQAILPDIVRGGVASIHHPEDDAATATAEMIAVACGAKARPCEDLADPALGLLEGLLASELADRYPKRSRQWLNDPLALVPPEGEALADARKRQFSAVSRILKKAKSDPVVFVMHPIGLGFLRCWLGEHDPSNLWRVLEQRPTVEQILIAQSDLDLLKSREPRPELAGRV